MGQLVRDFASEAVASGIPVRARRPNTTDAPQALMLRLDRRLACVELQPENYGNCPGFPMEIPLEEVSQISRDSAERRIAQGGPESAWSLTITAKHSKVVKMLFGTESGRDRAYMCLRIFQLSTD